MANTCLVFFFSVLDLYQNVFWSFRWNNNSNFFKAKLNLLSLFFLFCFGHIDSWSPSPSVLAMLNLALQS